MSDPNLVRSLQERTARARPADYVEHVDGWWLRYAPSRDWWLGAVLPHDDAEPWELPRRIARAEEFYAARGAQARFQISPGACPAALDALLAERGYRRQGLLSLRAAPTARVRRRARRGELTVRFDDRPTRTWYDTWCAAGGHGHGADAEWTMLTRSRLPCTYASTLIAGRTVAVGRAVVDTGWAGVFGMATLPEARGNGAAGHVLAALADWADSAGADQMYLQVECDNATALRVYARAGFTEMCRYHYRTARADGQTRATPT